MNPNYMKIKRDRSENWTRDEKICLIELVNKSKNVIECKTNEISAERKREAWVEIEKEMKSMGFDRNINRIKEQWRRMKTTSKWNLIRYVKKMQIAGDNFPEEPNRMDLIILDTFPELALECRWSEDVVKMMLDKAHCKNDYHSFLDHVSLEGDHNNFKNENILQSENSFTDKIHSDDSYEQNERMEERVTFAEDDNIEVSLMLFNGWFLKLLNIF